MAQVPLPPPRHTCSGEHQDAPVRGAGPKAPASENEYAQHPQSFERQSAKASRLRSEEHTSELQSRGHLVCRLLLEKKKKKTKQSTSRHMPLSFRLLSLSSCPLPPPPPPSPLSLHDALPILPPPRHTCSGEHQDAPVRGAGPKAPASENEYAQHPQSFERQSAKASRLRQST